MLYSQLSRRVSRFFERFNHKSPIRVTGHNVHNIAKLKLRLAVLLGFKTQSIKNRMGRHPEEVQHGFFAADVVDDYIFVPEIFFDPGHLDGLKEMNPNSDSIAQPDGRKRKATGWVRVGRLLAIVLALGSLLSTVGKIAHSEQPAVVINELMWMGSSSSTADEWLELHNLTDQPIDLSDWRLTKFSSGAEVAMVTIPAGKTIPAQGYFVVSNYVATSTSSVLDVTPDLVTTDVALANTALQVSLYDPAGTLIDRADDGTGNPLSGRYVSADKVYMSMERNPVPGDGTQAEAWHIASRSAGFKDGKPEIGTPGSVNSNGLPVASAGPDQSSVVGVDVNFDGSESIDPDGQTLGFSWNFGDNVVSSEITPKHRYAAAGEYTVTLSVNDGVDSATDSLSVTIALAPAAAPTTTSPTNTATTAAIIATSCRGILLSELFPNPDGVDDGEFIELANGSTKAVPLGGCAIWANDTRRYIFPAEIKIEARSWLAVQKSVSSLSLTNTGGTIALKDSDGTVLDTMTYPKSVENQTWAKIGQAWGWTNQPTPGAANKEATEDPDEGTAKKSSAKSGATKTPEEPPTAVSIAELQAEETGDHVQITGVVTVPIDVLAARTITLQDGSGATTALLAEDADKPGVGDRVELIGTVRSFQGRKRISVKAGDVHVIESDQVIVPKKITLDQLDGDLADQLVDVSGLIGTTSGAKILIDDGTGEAEIYLKSSTGIVKPAMQSGDRLAVVGIVSATTSGLRILPRTIDDLRVERVLGAATSSPVSTKVLPTAPPHQSQWYWGLVGLGVLVAGVKPLRDYLKKRKEA